MPPFAANFLDILEKRQSLAYLEKLHVFIRWCYAVKFQARAIQQIALHVHKKVAPYSISFKADFH